VTDDDSSSAAREQQADGEPRAPLALSWSGGKDSALALWALSHQRRRPDALITTVTDVYDRTSMHGVPRELLAQQADALGLSVVEVQIPSGTTTHSTTPASLRHLPRPLLLTYGRSPSETYS
jgi:hypothetical protein